MIEELQQKLGDEAEKLHHELTVILPREIEKALAQGDLRENSEHKAALERQGFVQARLGEIARRMSQLSDIDIEHVPVDRVGFGSRVTVRDLGDQTVESFNITLGDNVDIENNDISLESPIGKALLGKKKGDFVEVRLPFGARELEIVAFETLHEVGREEPRP